MRSSPTIPIFALAVLLWVAVLNVLRQRRARMAADPSPAQARSGRLHEVAALCATIGVTWFFAWFITDAARPAWLHVLAVRAAMAFIAVGAGVAAYAGWVGGP
jgi:hypothetical protein